MKFYLIGKKLGHSYSALIHRAKGLDYSLKELSEGEAGDFLQNGDFCGLNVTIPYKKTVIPYLDELSESAKEIGAVNTVLKKDGKLFGYNTDFGGVEYSFKRAGVSVENKTVCVLGAGGAAAAVNAYLSAAGAKRIYSVSRKGEINFDNYGAFVGDSEILVNATPVGMFPNVGISPADLSLFPELSFVFDCVYNPERTELVRSAKERGITALSGLFMLAEQALLAEDIWLGKTHTGQETEDIVRLVYKNSLNLVLAGMPGSGKTSLGKIVAETLGKKFVDTDEEITKKFGATPAEIIVKEGEEAFRKKESAVIKEVSALSGAVIATGGGAVIKTENVSALKSNGVIVYIKRDLSALSSGNRPITAKEGVSALYEKRRAVYESAADETVCNSADKLHAVKEIIKAYETACNKRS